MYKIFFVTVELGKGKSETWYFTEEVWQYRFRNHWSKFSIANAEDLDCNEKVYNFVYQCGNYGVTKSTLEKFFPDFFKGE